LCEIAQLGISVPPAFIIPTIGDAKQTGIRLDSDFLSECVKAVHELGLQVIALSLFCFLAPILTDRFLPTDQKDLRRRAG